MGRDLLDYCTMTWFAYWISVVINFLISGNQVWQRLIKRIIGGLQVRILVATMNSKNIWSIGKPPALFSAIMVPST